MLPLFEVPHEYTLTNAAKTQACGFNTLRYCHYLIIHLVSHVGNVFYKTLRIYFYISFFLNLISFIKVGGLKVVTLVCAREDLSIHGSAISVRVQGPELFLWLRLWGLCWNSCARLCPGSILIFSGHIPHPGAVYFLFHSAWAPHVNASGPYSTFNHTVNGSISLVPGQQRNICFCLTFNSLHLIRFVWNMYVLFVLVSVLYGEETPILWMFHFPKQSK